MAGGSPLSPALPLCPLRLDWSDIPNSVRLVAPDVGILLVSSLSLCLCRRLSPVPSRRNPGSLEPCERVRATPAAVGTSPSSLPAWPFPGHIPSARGPSSGQFWPGWRARSLSHRLGWLSHGGVSHGNATGSWQIVGWALWGAGPELEQGWVLCQPSLAVPAGHCDAVLVAPGSPRQPHPGDTPGPALGAPPWLWPCRAGTRAAAGTGAFTVSP